MAWGTTTTMVVMGLGSILAGAAGTGISMYGQQQQGEAAAAAADYNYKIQQRNAEINANAAKLQASWNAQTAANQAQTQRNNATVLDAQARAVEANSILQARQTREENEARQARQRVLFAKSGVTTEGSPLAVMAKAAGIMELEVQNQKYQSDMQANAYDQQAKNEKAGIPFSLFDEQVAKYEAAAAEAGRSIDLSVAAANRMAGMNQAQGYRIASLGTLFSGVSDIASTGYSYYDKHQTNKFNSTSVAPIKPWKTN